MSSSPRLHYLHETRPHPSAYNGAVSAAHQFQADMWDLWKQWEGRVVDGKFPLQRFLGGSDRSAVFLTQYSQGAAQRAVIKLVLADPKKAEAQLFRWKVATKLSAPGLIRIFHMGQARLDDTEVVYVVMEGADEDLAQILPERSLTPQETQDMLLPVLETLAYVHSKGFVHGSVKPSNILAVADRVKLSSDSLCAAQDQIGREREVSRYTAPEVAQGQISPASDVWSLGMTIVEVLTQRLPAANPALPGAVVVPDGMPEPFFGIAKRCLEADPRQRCAIADIVNVARLKPAPAATRATETLAPVTRKEQFSSKWLYLMAVAAVGLVALVWISNRKTKTLVPAERPAQVEQSAAPARPVLPKPSPTAPATAQSTQEPATSTAAAPSGTAPKPEAANLNTANGPVMPGVVHAVMPAVSRSARNTIQGKVKVRVRVQVDPSGNVISAKLESGGPSKYFARLAQEAAQDWKFTPAQAQGQDIASTWTLSFAFSRSDTAVVPKRINP